MNEDISTQSPNLDKIILKNVTVVVAVILEATSRDSVRLQSLTLAIKSHRSLLKIYSYTCTIDFQYWQ